MFAIVWYRLIAAGAYRFAAIEAFDPLDTSDHHEACHLLRRHGYSNSSGLAVNCTLDRHRNLGPQSCQNFF